MKVTFPRYVGICNEAYKYITSISGIYALSESRPLHIPRAEKIDKADTGYLTIARYGFEMSGGEKRNAGWTGMCCTVRVSVKYSL